MASRGVRAPCHSAAAPCGAGTASVEELVELLVAAEESSFSLFNYVNELNAEIEKLEDQIAGVRWVWALGGGAVGGGVGQEKAKGGQRAAGSKCSAGPGWLAPHSDIFTLLVVTRAASCPLLLPPGVAQARD